MQEKKAFKFQWKEIDDKKGTFQGYAAIFGNVDLGGDVVVKGAFKRSIDARQGRFKMLWSHDYKSPPIGIATVKEDDRGLLAIGELFFEKMQRATEVYEGIKSGAIDSLSFMYDVIQSEPGTMRGQKVRFLKELKLYEISPVNFPMNEEAIITGVKTQELNELAQRMTALEEKLKTMPVNTDFKEAIEKICSEVSALRSKVEELATISTSSTQDEPAQTFEAVRALVKTIAQDLQKIAHTGKR
jgi:HK97 family phage prohead protease